MSVVPSSFLAVLDQNVPYYLVIDATNTIVKTGSAVTRLLLEDIEGRYLTEVFEVNGTIDGGNPAFPEEGRSTTKLSSKARGIILEGVRWNLMTGGVWILSPSTSENAGILNVDDFPRVPANAGYFLQNQFQKLLLGELSEVTAREGEQRLRADKLLRDISLIAAITSHDICNYMQVISSELDEIALDEGAAVSRPNLLRAHEACELATMLLHSMLTISGHSRDSQTQFSIDSTILEVEGLLASLKPANVILELNLACEGVNVFGERGGFVSSLLNTVKNASEAFDGARGRITISTCRSIECPGRAFIKICDTGPGLRHTNIEFQTHDLFTTKRHGTGLGLASVREFCCRCAWTMELVSESGFGTSVLLSAPIVNSFKKGG